MSAENPPNGKPIPEKSDKNEEIEDAEFEEIPNSNATKERSVLIYEGTANNAPESENVEQLADVRERLGLSEQRIRNTPEKVTQIDYKPRPENALVVAKSRELILSPEANLEKIESESSPEEITNDITAEPEKDEALSTDQTENPNKGTSKKKNIWTQKIIDKEKVATVAQLGAGLGAVAGFAGLGVWASATFWSSFFGVAPITTAAIGLSMSGLGAGLLVAAGYVVLDAFAFTFVKNLLVDGYKWISGSIGKVMGGGGGGGGSKPAAKASGGGGSHGGGH